MISIFTDKEKTPDAVMLEHALGKTYTLWQEIEAFALKAHPKATFLWNYANKYGWSLRIMEPKRAIVYLLPRDGFFKTAFVFGAKATEQVLQSNVDKTIKTELEQAKPYAEGRGIRIEVRTKKQLNDIKELVKIKAAS